MAAKQLRVNAFMPTHSSSMAIGTSANELLGSKSLKDGGQLWQEWRKRLDAVGRGGEANHSDGQLRTLIKIKLPTSSSD